MTGDRIPDVRARRVVPQPDTHVLEEGLGRVTLRRRRFGPLRARILLLLRQDPDFTVRLDRLGTAAWRLFDGQRTVADVRALLQAQFPDEPDVGPRIGRFLSTLVSHGFVRLE